MVDKGDARKISIFPKACCPVRTNSYSAKLLSEAALTHL